MRKILFILLALGMVMLTSCFRTVEKQENVEKSDTVLQVVDTFKQSVDSVSTIDTLVVLYGSEE